MDPTYMTKQEMIDYISDKTIDFEAMEDKHESYFNFESAWRHFKETGEIDMSRAMAFVRYAK